MTATSFFAAGREQLVLGGLVEDVVDDLDRVDQAGLHGLEPFHGSQRLRLMPKPGSSLRA